MSIYFVKHLYGNSELLQLFSCYYMNNGVVYVQSEYPKYTPMLAKVLEGLLSGASDDDKYTHYQEASK
jgi:hypothetical protein